MFKYSNLRSKIWAFGMMQFAHAYLAKTHGLKFYKLMGSGKNEGFSPFPDWSTYGLLAVWEDESAANVFFDSSELSALYRLKTIEIWTIYMKNILARGLWSKQEPFTASSNLDKSNPLLAVITRATIRPSRLISFWKYVPTSHLSLLGNQGLIYTKGIGEVPIFQMATFSIWKNKDSLLEFAYKSREHHVAIQKTKELNWYSEEMFTRFQPYRSEGTWGGSKPLREWLTE